MTLALMVVCLWCRVRCETGDHSGPLIGDDLHARRPGVISGLLQAQGFRPDRKILEYEGRFPQDDAVQRDLNACWLGVDRKRATKSG